MKKSLLFLALFITMFYACTMNSKKNVQQQQDTALNRNVPENCIKDTSASNYKGFKSNIEKQAMENKNFRKVLYTSKHLQLVLMSLKPGEEIGAEIHPDNDQFFRFEGGRGKCIINGNEYNVENGDVIIVPAGARHNVINTDSKKELKMYTIYAPPHHKDGIIRATKEEAEKDAPEFDGQITE